MRGRPAVPAKVQAGCVNVTVYFPVASTETWAPVDPPALVEPPVPVPDLRSRRYPRRCRRSRGASDGAADMPVPVVPPISPEPVPAVPVTLVVPPEPVLPTVPAAPGFPLMAVPPVPALDPVPLAPAEPTSPASGVEQAAAIVLAESTRTMAGMRRMMFLFVLSRAVPHAEPVT